MRASKERNGSAPGGPLTWGQHVLWMEEQARPLGLEPIRVVIRIAPGIAPALVRRALTATQSRHESLRMRVDPRGNPPAQRFSAPSSMVLPVVDVGGVDERAAVRVAGAQSRRRFDLRRGPVWRALLIRSPDECLIVLTIHPIAGDAGSAAVIASELQDRLVSGPGEGGIPTAAARGFSLAQHQFESTVELAGQVDYWTALLSDLVPVALPPDHRREAPGHRITSVRFHLPDSVVRQITECGRRARSTEFMTLLAAFYLVLLKYSGAVDLAVASPSAHRAGAELEPVVGPLSTTLLLRLRIDPEGTVPALLAAVREAAVDAYDRQLVSPDRLAISGRCERDMGPSPLSAVAFGLRAASTTASERAPWTITTETTAPDPHAYDLALWLERREGGIDASMESIGGTLSAATLRRLADAYQQVLERMPGEPGRTIQDVIAIPSDERDRLVALGRSPLRAPKEDEPVHRLFEGEAARTPDATAVWCRGRHLSYRQLSARSTHVAHDLRARGVAPGDCVAISLDRSLESVVAALGVLKAGAYFLPVDPELPAERIRFMLDDMRVAAIITRESSAQVVDTGRGIPVLLINCDEPAAVGRVSPVQAFCRPTSLAYVMYTSGSSGLPKGVGIEHAAIRRLVRDAEYAQFDSQDRVAHLSNVAFDASTFEVWGPLLNGGCAVVMPTDVLLDTDRFHRFVHEHQLTTAFLTTALLSELSRRDGRRNGFASLRLLLAGGDAFHPETARHVLAADGPERLLNVYGPTETTTFASWQVVDDRAVSGPTVPIGRPIDETELYVLDAAMEPAPVRAAGELFIGGTGVARGYLNRPGLTAARFRPHPFARQPGARVYRTGDRVSWMEDGHLQFLGRLDRQIKLRGYRVDLSEIESALALDPDVGAAAVVLIEDQPGQKRLCAYVVPRGGSVTAESVRTALKTHLPAYMVPASVVVVETLPLTRNGKLDVRRLTEAPPPHAREGAVSGATRDNAHGDPDPSAPRSAADAPGTPLETLVADVWREVLNLERIGVHADFFDLGGHSLLAMQVVARLRDLLAADVTIGDLFDAPTVAGLSRRLEADYQHVEALLLGVERASHP